jgi:hypothetical protein
MTTRDILESVIEQCGGYDAWKEKSRRLDESLRAERAPVGLIAMLLGSQADDEEEIEYLFAAIRAGREAYQAGLAARVEMTKGGTS